MNGAEPGELAELAIAVAVRAGRMLTSQRPPGGPHVVGTKSSPTDVVTEMDRASERLIIDRIRDVRPGDAFLSEESGAVRPDTAPPDTVRPDTVRPGAARLGTGTQATPAGALVRWIIDPIDGTVNYLYGLPDWAVSIAAERSGRVVAGVVYVPGRGELFSAVRGGGAWLRRESAEGSHAGTEAARPVHCNSGVALSEALVATGFGYEAARRVVQGEVVARLLPRVRDIRRAGSAAVDLCAVAAGRVDAFYERGINYWDHAAAGLIAEEAGATIAGLNGKVAGPDLLIAAGPGLFARLHDLLAALDPERDAPT